LRLRRGGAVADAAAVAHSGLFGGAHLGGAWWWDAAVRGRSGETDIRSASRPSRGAAWRVGPEHPSGRPTPRCRTTAALRCCRRCCRSGAAARRSSILAGGALQLRPEPPASASNGHADALWRGAEMQMTSRA
jgi:hypothetical protein